MTAVTLKEDFVCTTLAKVTKMLAEARTAAQTKQVIDMARAAEVFARRQKYSEEGIAVLHSIMIDAKRQLGEQLLAAEKNGGAKGVGPIAVVQDDSNPVTLEQAGITRDQSAQSQFLARLAKSRPKEYVEIHQGRKSLKKSMREHNQEERRKKLEAAQKAPKLDEFTGPYDIILADPPWEGGRSERGSSNYPTATVDQICRHFDYANQERKDEAILFLWAPPPRLEDALMVMIRWGFRYRTHAVWDKEITGLDQWFFGSHELLLVGVRGEPKSTPESERVSSVFREILTNGLKKPKCVQEWIERAFPDMKKLEMYCRAKRPGWAAWGNEI